jgi:hypothetical protein
MAVRNNDMIWVNGCRRDMRPNLRMQPTALRCSGYAGVCSWLADERDAASWRFALCSQGTAQLLDKVTCTSREASITRERVAGTCGRNTGNQIVTIVSEGERAWNEKLSRLQGIGDLAECVELAVCKEAADAMDPSRRPSPIADSVQALNDDLHATFKHGYPDLGHRQEETLAA